MTQLDKLVDEFDYRAITVDNVDEVMEFLVQKCPVSQARDPRGGVRWIANKYDAVLNVLQDWRTFNATVLPEMPPMPPLTSNPPIQRHIREILNPFLSPQRVPDYEPGTRDAVRRLIDETIHEVSANGRCDISSTLFQPLPPILSFRLLLGIEEEELLQVRQWSHQFVYEMGGQRSTEAQIALVQWMHELIARRKAGERRHDVIDALVHGTVEDGRPLNDEELIGVVLVLMLGGFLTTTDGSSTFLVRLVENPDLQTRLRAEPSLIPKALEEHIRLMPPVVLMPRMCTHDTELGGRALAAGERVDFNVVAANRDPDEFDRPTEFDMDRVRNRHVSFGGGVHRCIGSNFARMSLRVIFEELLARLDDIRLVDGDSVRWSEPTEQNPNWQRPEYIPVTFEVRA